MVDTDKSPFPPANYKKFKPTGEVLTGQELDRINRRYPLIGHHATAFAIQYMGELPLVIEHLEKAGFKKVLDSVLHGGRAIVLEANHNQMIRIVWGDIESKRINQEFMLQPIATIDTPSGYRIEVLPKIHTLQNILDDKDLAKHYGFEHGSEETEMQYSTRLTRWAEGITNKLLKDMKGKGVRWDKDEVLYHNVAVIRYNNVNIPFAFDPGGMEQKAAIPDYQLSLPYAKAQEAHLEHLGLTKGKIYNIVTAVEQAYKDGGGTKGFCQCLDAERARFTAGRTVP